MLQHLYTLTPPIEEEDAPETAGDVVDTGSPALGAAPTHAWRLAVAAGGQRVALAAGDLLEVFDTTRPAVWPVCRFRLPLPAHLAQIAVHPSGDAMIFAEHGSIQALSRKVGDPSFPAAVPPEWGEPGAVSFDPQGEVVWASYADGDKLHVCALDWATRTLGLYGSVELAGIEDASHRLLFPPGRPGVVALALHHPERGATLHLVANRTSELEALDDLGTLASELRREPAFFAGFSADGARVALVRPDRIELWAPENRAPLGTRKLDDGMAFDAAGCFAGDDLVALLRATNDGSQRLTVFDGALQLRTNFAYSQAEGEPQAFVGLAGLADRRLLLLGEQRAGLFELADA